MIFTTCVVVAMAFAMPSHAQLLIPKQQGIEIMGCVPILNGEKLFAKNNFGVGVSITHYLRRANYAFLSAEYEQQNLTYRNYGVPMCDALLQLGYMQPILSDRGKNIFGYLGGLPSVVMSN